MGGWLSSMSKPSRPLRVPNHLIVGLGDWSVGQHGDIRITPRSRKPKEQQLEHEDVRV